MRLTDAQFLETPWYGSKQMARHLRREGYQVGRKRIRRLMAKMGLVPSISDRARRFRIRSIGSTRICCATWRYVSEPGLVRRHHVCSDAAWVLYLVAVMEWLRRARGRCCLAGVEHHGRGVLCDGAGGSAGPVRAPDDLQHQLGKPIHLTAVHRRVASGRGRHLHGRARAVVGQRVHERLWRSLKYECVYLQAFETGSELRAGLSRWISYYNARRPNSSLAGRTPDEAYGEGRLERLAA